MRTSSAFTQGGQRLCRLRPRGGDDFYRADVYSLAIFIQLDRQIGFHWRDRVLDYPHGHPIGDDGSNRPKG